MPLDNTIGVSGDLLQRLRQALIAAQHQARAASAGRYGRHVADVLTELEGALTDQSARVEAAIADDAAEAEASSAADDTRQAHFSRYRAA